mmetsp:Transcript_2095/g.6205  ORF Transcript_2095/g.6205 Transcript_2095/m.6205 type:complete len:301 (+) Transcript_2095:5355-6257(+)
MACTWRKRRPTSPTTRHRRLCQRVGRPQLSPLRDRSTRSSSSSSSSGCSRLSARQLRRSQTRQHGSATWSSPRWSLRAAARWITLGMRPGSPRHLLAPQPQTVLCTEPATGSNGVCPIRQRAAPGATVAAVSSAAAAAAAHRGARAAVAGPRQTRRRQRRRRPRWRYLRRERRLWGTACCFARSALTSGAAWRNPPACRGPVPNSKWWRTLRPSSRSCGGGGWRGARPPSWPPCPAAASGTVPAARAMRTSPRPATSDSSSSSSAAARRPVCWGRRPPTSHTWPAAGLAPASPRSLASTR